MDGEPAGAASPVSRAGVPALVDQARRGCRAELAAVGWRSGDDLVVVPGPHDPAAAATDGDDVATARALLRLAWADPELDHAPVLVRTSTLPGDGGEPRRATLAVVPLPPAEPAAGPEGLLCVVGPAGGTFTPGQLDRLVEVGGRLSSYRRARRVLGVGGDGPGPAGVVPAGPAGRSVDRDRAGGAS